MNRTEHTNCWLTSLALFVTLFDKIINRFCNVQSGWSQTTLILKSLPSNFSSFWVNALIVIVFYICHWVYKVIYKWRKYPSRGRSNSLWILPILKYTYVGVRITLQLRQYYPPNVGYLHHLWLLDHSSCRKCFECFANLYFAVLHVSCDLRCCVTHSLILSLVVFQ